jgi:lipopolysaccharide/colanic/teichoic acid biosynthesis glycosyltransferase
MKRIGDLLGSIIGLVIASPIIAILCIIIVMDSPGSPIFIQERLGINGKKFMIIKLRSMNMNAEENGVQWAEKFDHRITKVGKFIRRTRLDELPQLINILKGDMSFIGPRPERPHFYNEFEKYIPDFRSRLKVMPGLTGWGQINGGYDLPPEQKYKFDMEYIDQASLWFDCLIFFKTIKVVFTGKGAR